MPPTKPPIAMPPPDAASTLYSSRRVGIWNMNSFYAAAPVLMMLACGVLRVQAASEPASSPNLIGSITRNTPTNSINTTAETSALVASQCLEISNSQTMPDYNGYSVVASYVGGSMTTSDLDAFIKTRQDSHPTYIQSFQQYYNCPNFAGRNQRFHMSLYQSTLISTSQNPQNTAGSCPTPPTNQQLCQSTCLMAVQSLQSIFNDPKLCSPEDPNAGSTGNRANDIALFQAVCATLPSTNCLSAVKSEITQCGFFNFEDAKAYCSLEMGGQGSQIQDPCCAAGITPATTKKAESTIKNTPGFVVPIIIAGVILIVFAGVAIVYYIRRRRQYRLERDNVFRDQEATAGSFKVLPSSTTSTMSVSSASSSASSASTLAGVSQPGSGNDMLYDDYVKHLDHSSMPQYERSLVTQLNDIEHTIKRSHTSKQVPLSTDINTAVNPVNTRITSTTNYENTRSTLDKNFEQYQQQNDSKTNEYNSDNDIADEPILFQSTVIYNYDATLHDELRLVPGDTIDVLSLFDDGWAIGIVNGQRGFFPLACVAPLKRGGVESIRFSIGSSAGVLGQRRESLAGMDRRSRGSEYTSHSYYARDSRYTIDNGDALSLYDYN